MTSVAKKEATIKVPFQYVWHVDPEHWEMSDHGETVESPLFGPENFDMIKFKLQLLTHSEYASGLILFSSIEPELNLKYKVIPHQTFCNIPFDLKILESQHKAFCTKLSIGQKTEIVFNDFKSVASIQCGFELCLPEKIESFFRKLEIDSNTLRLKSHFMDVTFVVGTREFLANKNILSVRSPVFEVMFGREEFVENQQNRVEVIDIDEKVFGAFLDFVYTSQVKLLDENEIELMFVAHKYDIKSLLQLCSNFMKKKITAENVVYYLLYADMYNLADLKKATISYINRDASIIAKSEDWIKHVKPNISLMNDLYLNWVAKELRLREHQNRRYPKL